MGLIECSTGQRWFRGGGVALLLWTATRQASKPDANVEIVEKTA